MTDDTLLPRFFHALVEALRERSPSDLERPFTVAEIYQDLVPYRTHRDLLGVEMNGDYEHALLRLLAGEGGYLRLESEHALRDIREELEEKAPNTTVYRDYAAVDVRVDPIALRSAPEPSAVEAEPVDATDLAPTPAVDAPHDGASAEAASFADAPDETGASEADPELASESDLEPVTTAPADRVAVAEAPTESPLAHRITAPAAPSSPAPASAVADGHCRWCRSELPKRDDLRYCPFCGQDLSLVPCRSCGEALEPGWLFCITCGAQVAS